MEEIRIASLRDKENRILLFKLVSRLIPISTFIGEGKMHSCPFHSDSNPSAQLFEDPEGERLFCHGCRKQYTSYHYIKTILEEDPYLYLVSKFPEVVIKSTIALIQSNGESLTRTTPGLGKLLEELDKGLGLENFLIEVYHAD